MPDVKKRRVVKTLRNLIIAFKILKSVLYIYKPPRWFLVEKRNKCRQCVANWLTDINDKLDYIFKINFARNAQILSCLVACILFGNL